MSKELNEKLESSIALVDRRSASLTTGENDPLLGLMNRFAANDGLSPEKAKALMDIYIDGQRRMQEMQDEREYYERMAEFKRNPPEVIKKLTAKIKGQGRSGNEYQFDVPYADLNAFADAAMADLAERGITWDFEIIETGVSMTVTCLLHYGLYTRRGSPATGDPKMLQSLNAFMQKGAAQSFLMRYSFCASTGLTAALPGDKNGTTLTTPAEALKSTPMDQQVFRDFISSIEGAGSHDELQTRYFEARDAAAKLGDAGALIAFEDAKNKRLAQLNRQKAGK